MISEVVMPQMGADMEEGTIVTWLKQEGDGVERGEIIAEIETDKANVEIEAFESGIFRRTLANEGDTVAVGAIIAIIAAEDEDVSGYEQAVTVTDAAPASDGASSKQQTGAKAPAEAPAAATLEAAEPPSRATPVASPGGRVRASPVARKLALERGLDLATIAGTGPDGRIVRRDVEAAAPAAGAPAVSAAPAGAQEPVAPAKAPPSLAPMSRMRQRIAQRMTQSKQEAPHYYITVDVDMGDAERTRGQLKEVLGDEVRVSVNDLIVKASAMALARHREFNAWFLDGEVRRVDAINVCIAIALEDGLIAPAILDCEHKSLREISQDGRSLAERARSGKLKPAEISEGTFTVSNLGMFDVTSLVAIIQPPQTAILGVGAVRSAPLVRDGRIEPGRVMTLALSGDHRVTDGAQGAQFLNEIRRLLQSPAGLLF